MIALRFFRILALSSAAVLTNASSCSHVSAASESRPSRPSRPARIRTAPPTFGSTLSLGSPLTLQPILQSVGIPRGGDQPSAAAATKKKRRRKKKSSSGVESVVTKDSDEDEKPTKKKRRKRGKPSTDDDEEKEEEEGEKESTDVSTEQLKEAMRKNKDMSAALGDAIRDRADILRSDEVHEPPLQEVDASIASVGLALGSSDPAAARARLLASAASSSQVGQGDGGAAAATAAAYEEDEGGGVEASSSAVLANYFLQSHGGAHGIQSALSLLAVLTGLGALLVSPPSIVMTSDGGADAAIPTGTKGWMKLILLRRCLLCALAKHAAGLVAATTLSASRLSKVGFQQTRRRMEALSLDPVAQYAFYCALLLLWAPSLSASTVGGTAAAAAAKGIAVGGGWFKRKATQAATEAATATAASSVVAPKIPWWLSSKTTSFYSTLCILGPILLREVVSTAWVISDVFVILASSGASDGSEPFLLTSSRKSLDVVMNLLFTPSKWKEADVATRQRLLAKIVAKSSLALEIMVGLIIAYDFVRVFLDYTVSPGNARPSLSSVIKRLVCARLYLNFMLVRRKKITSLVNTLRGGAAYVPGRILDVLLAPKKEMGFGDEEEDGQDDDENDAEIEGKPRSWRDYVSMALDV